MAAEPAGWQGWRKWCGRGDPAVQELLSSSAGTGRGAVAIASSSELREDDALRPDRGPATMHEILKNTKFCKDMTVKYDSRLRERKYGIAESKALSELRAMAKAAGEECPVFTPPGGETLDQVKMRGKDFFEFLCQLILKETGQKEQFPQGAPSNCLEASLAEIFPLGKNHGSEFNPDSGAPELVASVLVVSHGGYMKGLFEYFVTDLKCSLPTTQSKFELTSVSPNTGISVFVVNLEEGEVVRPAMQCVCLNLQDHLGKMTEAH
ncbi:putative fructose-2,6-bisphosphatase TIGAR [Tupaia chinensis]|uniref:Putative fructose-2,6-bisphosphatase TIGAR n=1 Tax=Tupaia chinensis TaxID=246437 RepID=L8Y449_TUPCH|nr:putative fructose-2,6-bisphosphatase TIGAR [Tupaia chinensis]